MAFDGDRKLVGENMLLRLEVWCLDAEDAVEGGSGRKGEVAEMRMLGEQLREAERREW